MTTDESNTIPTSGMNSPKREPGWMARHASLFGTLVMVTFGALWAIAAWLKFQPGLVSQFPDMVSGAGQGQPDWLAGWFSFWAGQAAANAAFWIYLTGVLEAAIALSLILGFLQKIGLIGGAVLSLFIWAVPEGFGGPYGTGSTDVGAGVNLAIFFVALMVIVATLGPSRFSLDYYLSQRYPFWARLALFQTRGTPAAPEPRPLGRPTGDEVAA